MIREPVNIGGLVDANALRTNGFGHRSQVVRAGRGQRRGIHPGRARAMPMAPATPQPMGAKWTVAKNVPGARTDMPRKAQ